MQMKLPKHASGQPSRVLLSLCRYAGCVDGCCKCILMHMDAHKCTHTTSPTQQHTLYITRYWARLHKCHLSVHWVPSLVGSCSGLYISCRCTLHLMSLYITYHVVVHYISWCCAHAYVLHVFVLLYIRCTTHDNTTHHTTTQGACWVLQHMKSAIACGTMPQMGGCYPCSQLDLPTCV